MNKIHLKILALTLGALPAFAHANSFEETARHLDLDGSLVAYIDFAGDGAEIGGQLNSIYTSVQQSTPEMPPMPIDFTLLFENLGFGSIRAMGVSSKEIEAGLFKNRYVTLLNGQPKGLFALYGTQQDSLTEFTAASQAPADATGAVTGTLNLLALRDSISAVMQQVMGPMGETLVQQQISQPVPGTDITVNELIEALSGKVDFTWQQKFDANMQQSFKARARLEGAGSLLARLQPLSESWPIIFTEDASGLTADFSQLIQQENIGLFLFAPADSDALVMYTHPDWTVEHSGSSLAETPEFQKLAGRLPHKAHAFSYNRGVDMEPILQMLDSTPQMAAYSDTIRKTIDLLIGDFLKPNVTAMTLEDDAIVQDQYAGYSTKQAVMTLPAAVIGGLTSAMAIPAFNKVRTTSQQKAVLNNLRQIASAADQYFLETGKTSVTVSELVGPQAYIRQLDPVMGEDYSQMVITTETETISITLPDGRVVSCPF